MLTRRMRATEQAQHDDSMSAVSRRLRSLPVQQIVPVAQRHAAVLVPLFEDGAGVVQVVLTQRAHSLSSHGGEVALPGGKRDATDADDVATALREAHEELGIAPDEVAVVATMPPVLSKHLFSVVPVVGLTSEAVARRAMGEIINRDEVAAVFAQPLRRFLEAKGHSNKDIVWDSGLGPGVAYRLHYFQSQDPRNPICWGLTAGILINAAALALDREPEFDVYPPGGRPYTDIIHDGTVVRYVN